MRALLWWVLLAATMACGGSDVASFGGDVAVGVGGGSTSSAGGAGGAGGEAPACTGTGHGDPGAKSITNGTGNCLFTGARCNVMCLPDSTAIDQCWPNDCGTVDGEPAADCGPVTWGSAPAVGWSYVACQSGGESAMLLSAEQLEKPAEGTDPTFAGILHESQNGQKTRCGDGERLDLAKDAFPADYQPAPSAASFRCETGSRCYIVRRWQVCSGCADAWYSQAIPGTCTPPG